MAAELVNSATCEKLTEMDWIKNIEICELVARDQRQARDVMKAIKKRLASKNSNTQLFAVLLLEMLMNNIGDHVHKQVIDTGILPVLVKIVKKRSDLPVREKIFLLLDATQTSLGGASGKFPQYYSAYYDLVSAGVQFPNRPHVNPSNHPLPDTKKNETPAVVPAPSHEKRPAEPVSQAVPESSIIKKAASALEVLKEVLDAVDTQHPEASKDEFTLDLVEQCSFQKQRVMHLAMTSRDDNVISQAIELNEQLQRVLTRHDELISGRSTSTSSHSVQGEAEEEEEAEQLFRRIRKGKACAKPEDEGCRTDQQRLGFLESLSPGEKLHRPIIRPLSVEPPPSHESINSLFSPGEKLHHSVVRPLSVEPPPVHEPNSTAPLAFSLPPPPAKHVEREKFFQEKKPDAGGGLAGHVRGLSLHSRNGSSSYNGSIDDSD